MLEFSPFNALDLGPDAYDAKEIKKAYHKAILKCHPDKLPDSQQPTLLQLQNARDELLKDCETSSLQYQHFPLIEAYDIEVRVGQDVFKRCPCCTLVIHLPSWSEHLNYHGKTECSICIQLIADKDLESHMEAVHNLQGCGICIEYLDEAEIKEHRRLHQCPLCKELPYKGTLLLHAKSSHGLTPCQDCEEETISRHLTNHHWIQCPCCLHQFSPGLFLDHIQFCQCLELCELCGEETDRFPTHLEKSHDYHQCPVCPRYVSDETIQDHLNAQHDFQRCAKCYNGEISTKHIQRSHQFQNCEVCDEKIDEVFYTTHLRFAHKWKKCTYCEAVMPVKDLEKHISSHQLETCQLCHESVPQDQYRQHLGTSHAYHECPICDVLESRQTIQQHVQRHLLATECKECGNWETDLSRHLQEAHAHEKCGFCDSVLPKPLLADHIRTVHQPEKCPQCDDSVAQAQLTQHLISTHEFRQCSWCPHLSQHLLPHILGTHATVSELQETLNSMNGRRNGLQDDRASDLQSRLAVDKSGKCPDCPPDTQIFLNLYEHRRRHHNYKKRSNADLTEPRVHCDDCGTTRSRSNKSRCKCRR